MAQQIVGADGSTIVKIDPSFGALRVTPRPLEALAWLQISAKSGALTTVTGSTANLVFALRNGGTNLYLVRKIQIGYITTTGYTAAQYQDFGAYIARSYTAASSGGTAITISGNTNKLRTSLATLTTPDCRISTTAALTAGTLAVDTNPIGVYGNWCAAATAGAGFGLTTIFDQGPGDYPLVLGNQEGLVICPITTMGAAGVGFLTVMVEVAETTTALFV